MSGTSAKADANPVDVRLALIEKDFVVVNELNRKMEAAVEKTSEAIVLMQRVIDLHELRLENRDKADRDHTDRLEKMSTEVRTTIREEIRELKSTLDEAIEGFDEQIEALETRVRDLERWRWFIVGGSAVLGFIIAKLPLFVALLGPAAGAGG